MTAGRADRREHEIEGAAGAARGQAWRAAQDAFQFEPAAEPRAQGVGRSVKQAERQAAQGRAPRAASAVQSTAAQRHLPEATLTAWAQMVTSKPASPSWVGAGAASDGMSGSPCPPDCPPEGLTASQNAAGQERHSSAPAAGGYAARAHDDGLYRPSSGSSSSAKSAKPRHRPRSSAAHSSASAIGSVIAAFHFSATMGCSHLGNS